MRQVAGLILATCFFFLLPANAARQHSIAWQGVRSSVPSIVVNDLSPNETKLLRAYLEDSGHPSDLLSVRVRFSDTDPADLPSLSGKWTQLAKGLKFEPEFPLSPGLIYVATFRLPQSASVSRSTKIMTKAPTKPRAIVSAVYPSSEVLPENLLKFYLHFSHPMSRGDIYRHITLLDEQEQAIDLPFLEIGEELWDPAQKRLTLLIDPGRTKRGLKPHEDIGPSIQAGRRYTLHISREWQDARGAPLRSDHRKHFRAGPPDRSPPNPHDWRIISPPPGSREPLQIYFPDPLDHALASRVIWIEDSAGEPVRGEVILQQEETRWLLKPEKGWKPGRYHLRAELILEDLAGNSIGRPFEVDVFERVDDGITEVPFGRSFKIGP